MQVSVEEREGLERCMTVQVPAEQIDKEVQNRLHSLSRKARIDGFRPGKVPVKVVKQMYGMQVRQEVLSDVLQNTFRDAVTQEQLRIAGSPVVEPVSMAEGSNLEYKATFEVFPEFEPKGIDGLSIKRPTTEIAESDVDAMLQSLREQRTVWTDVERPSQSKDQVTITFEGSVDGEPFEQNKGEEVPVVIGSGSMVPGFEDQLSGHSAGSEIDFDVTFPDDYQATELAGKLVHFEVKIDKVAEPSLPVVDADFIAGFGVEDGGIEALRKSLRENMERELEEKIKARVKQQVMDGLLAGNSIPAPQALVREEIENMAREARLPPSTESTDEKLKELKTQLFQKDAERRVTLGLIVSRLVTVNQLQLDEAKVQARLESMAASYEDKEQFISWYRQNTDAMTGLQTLVLEEQMVDWLLESAEVVDEPLGFEEIMRPPTAATQETPASTGA